jgi:hypothetical protein
MTELVQLEALEENEDGTITVSLHYSKRGQEILLEKGFLLLTLCGMYRLDSGQILDAVRIGAEQLNATEES